MTQLDPVQIAAIDFAYNKRGVGWFMEQGLGKTLTALSEFDRMTYSWSCDDGSGGPADADRMIVVCPNSFKKGWVDEIEKHGFRFTPTIYQSSKKAHVGRFLDLEGHGAPPVLVINYDAIRSPAVLKAVILWAKKGKAYLAIDESIQIKGHRSKQTKAILQLASVCSWVRILTGRPQTQGPHDLWGQLRAIEAIPSNMNFYSFRGSFCIMGGYMMKEVVKAKHEDVLASMMEPFVFQAKKKDWLPDLPRKDATIRDYEMSGVQKKQYDSMEDNFLLYLANEKAITVDVAIAKFEKLAQIQTGFIYGETGIVHELVEPDANPRLNLLKEILLETEGKVCVVYRHRPVFDMLNNELQFYKPAHIKGGMAPDDVEFEKNCFNSGPGCRVILLQAEASKYGHTLLGGPNEEDKCRTMVFFENSYSADTRDQIEDRIHRRGQTGERVLYIDLSGSDLDRRIVKALQRKDALYASVFKNLKTAQPKEFA